MADPLELGSFEALVGDAFAVDAETEGANVSVELVLTDVTPAPPPAPGLRQGFSLRFQGPEEPLLASGTYRFQHESVGPTAIFISPVSASASDVVYEAVFG